MSASSLLLLCRPGFEAECGQELESLCAAAGDAAWCEFQRGSGWVLAHSADGAAIKWPPWQRMIFARQRIELIDHLRELPATDRLQPISAALKPDAGPWREVIVEHPDSDLARPLAVFCRKFAAATVNALRRGQRLSNDKAAPSLHLFFPDTGQVLIGETRSSQASPWPGGIPRLRRLREAPSRSASKLDEALQVLFEPGERERLMKAGQRGVDLGAAPGGWTWILTRQHLHVTAVDNGPMDADLMETGLVTHLREDGFRYRPQRPVDWLVCDMVEQPARIAALMVSWLRDGDCRQAIFNLKLPMKRRWEETRRCLGQLDEAGLSWRARQLYHDREEITVRAWRSGLPA